MNIQPLTAVLDNPTSQAIETFLDDERLVFWVDWREEAQAIVEYCETILQTGCLSAEYADDAAREIPELYVVYRSQRVQAPLTHSGADRHHTLCTLNEALFPDYEVRFCIDSDGGDTLAFVPLAADLWKKLETQYGARVGEHFYQIASAPNVFTDRLSFGSPLSDDKPFAPGALHSQSHLSHRDQHAADPKTRQETRLFGLLLMIACAAYGWWTYMHSAKAGHLSNDDIVLSCIGFTAGLGFLIEPRILLAHIKGAPSEFVRFKVLGYVIPIVGLLIGLCILYALS